MFQLFALTALAITGCKKHENSSSPVVPTVITKAATGITSYTATMNGIVNANNLSTAVSFSYGLTVAYGTNIPAAPDSINGTSNTNVSANITGLIPDTTYHFRVVATNRVGTTTGHDSTFRTQKQQWLIAGIPDSGIIIKEMNPAVVLQCFFCQLNYAVDINSDNINDINLSLWMDWLYGGMCLESYEYIETLNNETFVLTDSAGYPKVLSIGDTIKTDGIWRTGNLILLSYYAPCPEGIGDTIGYWRGVNEKCVGIKCNGLLGWMLIGTPWVNTYPTINFYEYAITK